MKTRNRLLLLAAITLNGCGGTADEDAASQLTGTWQRFADDGTVRDELTFGADFSYAFDERDGGTEDHLRGTFTIVDGIIVVEGDGFSQRMSYAIDGGRLAPGAGIRIDGDPDEVPGTYRAEMLFQSGSSTTGGVAENELRADGTAQQRTTDSAGTPMTFDGTWAYDDATQRYVMRLEASSSVTVQVAFDFRADAIGDFAWVRR